MVVRIESQDTQTLTHSHTSDRTPKLYIYVRTHTHTHIVHAGLQNMDINVGKHIKHGLPNDNINIMLRFMNEIVSR